MMLELDAINAGYGRLQILFDVSLQAAPGEITCLLGRNGAGKTTTLKAIMGLIRRSSGAVRLDGEDLTNAPAHEASRHRIGYVPQGRRLFSELTVEENIEIGLMARGAGAKTRDWVLSLFPRLEERMTQRAETLSGGEQQMLATARALCVEPKALLLDEPTEGLQPSMIVLIRDVVVKLKSEGVAILLVEQRIDAVLEIADRAVFLENGRSVQTATGDELRADPSTLHRYLGV